MIYNEMYRPQYHFSPRENWINDPNGLVYYDGEYHLFFQYHPYDKIWGPMHWGHAISQDMIHWKELHVALEPDALGTIFSGCAVVDSHNSSGFQTGEEKVLIVLFTQHEEHNQKQSLAYSNDRGRTWTKYDKNPIIKNPGISDFRDPKVFWHQPSRNWIMILACHDCVRFYSSTDLKEWTYLSEFGHDHGAHGGVWECPDLFQLAVDGIADVIKWVLVVSISDGAPNGGPGVQYFIGTFDGKTFINDNDAEELLWADYGRDFYAAVTWYEETHDTACKIWIGWMNNWTYANHVPTHPWRGAMTLPRELKLVYNSDKKTRLVQIPIEAVKDLRDKEIAQFKHISIKPENEMTFSNIGEALQIKLKIRISDMDSNEFGIKLNDVIGNECCVRFNKAAMKIILERNTSGINFSDKFAGCQFASVSLNEDILDINMFIDASLIEIFANDGQTVMSSQFFLNDRISQISLYSSAGQTKLEFIEIYSLNSIWA